MNLDVYDDNDNELNFVANEILKRTATLKKTINSSMVVGDKYIIMGIEIFNNVIIKLNPKEMDDEIVSLIESLADEYLSQKNYKIQFANPYIRFGINNCFMILETYNNIKSKIKKYSL